MKEIERGWGIFILISQRIWVSIWGLDLRLGIFKNRVRDSIPLRDEEERWGDNSSFRHKHMCVCVEILIQKIQ